MGVLLLSDRQSKARSSILLRDGGPFRVRSWFSRQRPGRNSHPGFDHIQDSMINFHLISAPSVNSSGFVFK